jgi:GNAT superfamily N-acetyltransferase
MTAADVPLAMALKEQALWNQTADDWRRFLALEPQGCFVAHWHGQPAGTAAAFVFGRVGWIAMVLVDRALRGRGIATRLMEHALAYLDGRGVRSVRLDATSLGRPIYERLGFTAQWELARLEGVARGPEIVAQAAPGLVPFSALSPAQFAELSALDAQTNGTDRQRLLALLDCDAPGAARALLAAGRLRGFAMLRNGSRATQIGPVAALDDEAGLALFQALARQTAARPIFVDIPDGNLPALAWAQSRGLAVQRRFTRMLRGQPIVERPAQLWASSGPEKG